MTGSSFTVRVSLRDTPATEEELVQETAGQIADFDPRFDHDPAGRTSVTLHVTAADLWVAVLLAMSAVARTGHQPDRLEAMHSPGPSSPTGHSLPIRPDEPADS